MPATISEITGHSAVMPGLPDHNLPLPYCLMGVEVELENVANPRQGLDSRLWSVQREGSLRGEYPVEFCFAQPLCGTAILKALQNLEEVCTRSNEPSPSERTSVHIHVDVRDMDIEEVMRFIMIYLLFERTLVRYHGDVREENIFCLPYYKAPGTLVSALGWLRSTGIRHASAAAIRNSFRRFSKYSGLNLSALFSHGSIEFRHMAGTWSSEAIYNWIHIVQSLKKAAESFDFSPWDVYEWAESVEVEDLLPMVFGDSSELLWNSFEKEDLEVNYQMVQDILNHGVMNRASNSAVARHPGKAWNYWDNIRNYLAPLERDGINVEAWLNQVNAQAEIQEDLQGIHPLNQAELEINVAHLEGF